MSRTREQALASRRGAHKAGMDFLRARPGQKFFAVDIATAIGHPPQQVAAALGSLAIRAHTSLKSELCPSGSHQVRRFWVGDTKPADETERVRVWLKRHHKAARPSEVAKGVKSTDAAVAAILCELEAAGEVVCCRLPMRSGFDKYEYKLLGAY